MYALAVETMSGAMQPMALTAERFDEAVRWGTPSNPDRETWGESPEAQAAARAMLDLAGGGAKTQPA